MREFLSWIREEESGQGMVEYGIIVALVVVIAISVFGMNKTGPLGVAISGVFTKISDAIGTLDVTP